MKNNKQLVIRILVGGLVYAGLVPAWDYHDGELFKPRKFLFFLLFFGGSLGIL